MLIISTELVMSAIQIVIRASLAIFVTGFASMVFMPLMYELSFQNDYWDTAPTNQLVIRDNIYNIFLLLPAFLIGSVILWAYINSTRKTVDEF